MYTGTDLGQQQHPNLCTKAHCSLSQRTVSVQCPAALSQLVMVPPVSYGSFGYSDFHSVFHLESEMFDTFAHIQFHAPNTYSYSWLEVYCNVLRQWLINWQNILIVTVIHLMRSPRGWDPLLLGRFNCTRQYTVWRWGEGGGMQTAHTAPRVRILHRIISFIWFECVSWEILYGKQSF